MELFPALQIGWLNGWLFLCVLYLIFGLLLLVFPKDVVRRLYDRSGWSKRERVLNAIGQLVSFTGFVVGARQPQPASQQCEQLHSPAQSRVPHVSTSLPWLVVQLHPASQAARRSN